MLQASDIEVRYGRLRAIKGISFNVSAGEILAVVGANGAGKSSLLRSLLGIEPSARGSVIFRGQDITNWSAGRRVANGMVLVPEGRRISTSLTIHDNLLVGAYHRHDTSTLSKEVNELYERFPNLARRRNELAAVLSGGEQQMLALGRALLAAPQLIMLDEPSLGLSPKLADEIFSFIADLRYEREITVLLVEQNTIRALDLADRAIVLELGSIAAVGTPDKIFSDDTLASAYLGTTSVPRATTTKMMGGPNEV